MMFSFLSITAILLIIIAFISQGSLLVKKLHLKYLTSIQNSCPSIAFQRKFPYTFEERSIYADIFLFYNFQKMNLNKTVVENLRLCINKTIDEEIKVIKHPIKKSLLISTYLIGESLYQSLNDLNLMNIINDKVKFILEEPISTSNALEIRKIRALVHVYLINRDESLKNNISLRLSILNKRFMNVYDSASFLRAYCEFNLITKTKDEAKIYEMIKRHIIRFFFDNLNIMNFFDLNKIFYNFEYVLTTYQTLLSIEECNKLLNNSYLDLFESFLIKTLLVFYDWRDGGIYEGFGIKTTSLNAELMPIIFKYFS